MQCEVDAATLFAFDFIVEKLSDVRTLDQIEGVAFKLLDYPTVPVPLTNAHPLAPRRYGDVPARCSVRLNKGKSVVFEMNPNELSRGLGETPVEILLLTSGAAESDSRSLLPSQSSPFPVVGRGELDLSHVAARLEAAVKPHLLHACRLRRKPDTVESRHTVECTDSDGGTVARVRVKCRLACIPGCQKKGNAAKEIRNRVPDKESTTTAAQPESQETVLGPPVGGITHRGLCSGVIYTPGKENEKREESKLESAVEKNGRSLLQECKLSYPVTSHEPALRDYENVCERLDGGYIPNLVCPPPLYYHSEVKAKEHLHSETVPCNSTNESAGDIGVYFDGIAQAESRDHWSVVARYVHASHPLTTQYEDLPIQDAPRSNETAAVCIQQEGSQRHLPLLSGLLQELASLQANTKSFQPVKESPETVSTFVQTENVERKVEQSKKGSKIRNTHRTPTSHRIPRSRFIRECCQLKKPQGKLVPRGKSVLYPPDIKHKWRKIHRPKEKSNRCRHFPGFKEKKLGTKTKKVGSSNGDDPYTDEKNPATTTEEIGGSNGNVAHTDDNYQRKTQLKDGSPSVRKLEVFIPCALPLSSPSLSSFSSPKVSLVPQTLIQRSNIQTQTEGRATEKVVASLTRTTPHITDLLTTPSGGRGLYEDSSQTVDSFTTAEMLEVAGDEKGIFPERARNSVVFLVSSQSSFSTSTEGTLDGEEEEGEKMKGEEEENKEKREEDRGKKCCEEEEKKVEEEKEAERKRTKEKEAEREGEESEDEEGSETEEVTEKESDHETEDLEYSDTFEDPSCSSSD